MSHTTHYITVVRFAVIGAFGNFLGIFCGYPFKSPLRDRKSEFLKKITLDIYVNTLSTINFKESEHRLSSPVYSAPSLLNPAECVQLRQCAGRRRSQLPNCTYIIVCSLPFIS